MPDTKNTLYNRITPYLHLAADLSGKVWPLIAIKEPLPGLPPLDETGLDQLSLYLDNNGLLNPASVLVVTAIIDKTVQKQKDTPLVQARAAWLLARAANLWTRPDLAAEAVGRAAEIFSRLEEKIWLAACSWQRNALPWTRPDFRQAAAELRQALTQLEGSFLDTFTPGCRLSLAYAQLLTGEFEAALASIAASESEFEARGDEGNLARCWMRRSSVLRRQDKTVLAQYNLIRAQEIFQRLSAPVQEAKVLYQMAYMDLSNRNDYPAAEQYFQRAKGIFSEHGVNLWAALCDHALGQVYLESGQISAAGEHLAQASNVLVSFNVVGALGDALFDSAKYARLIGDHATSVRDLQEAIGHYTRVDAPFMVALAAMHLGSTYREWGYHQQGLHYLEQAQQQFSEMKHYGRLAECHMRLAHLWLQVNRLQEADDCLRQAVHYYELDERPAYLATIYGRQAEIAMLADDSSQAISYLEKAVALAERHNLGLQIATARRLLGECLCLSGNPEDGLEHLQLAVTRFEEMGLVFDQAACLVAIGNGHLQLKNFDTARTAWQTALSMEQEMVPALIWRARAGLARLAEGEGNHPEALNQYRMALAALNRQRRDFWQPHLAGNFFQKATAMIDQAVSLAVQSGESERALQFVEAGKAQSMFRRLLRLPVKGGRPSQPAELRTAAAEIQTLYDRIHSRKDQSGYRHDPQLTGLFQQLLKKIETYRTGLSQWERQNLQDFSLVTDSELDVNLFCRTAKTELSGPCVAISYYLTEEALYISAVTDNRCYAWKRPITAQTWYAIESCIRGRVKQVKPTAQQMEILGDWLLPDEVAGSLTADTYLILAPHQRLHHLPWAALTVGSKQIPLVKSCIPVIVPSLTSLLLLWQRPVSEPAPDEGLLIGTSEFPKRPKRSLPEVEKELGYLVNLLAGKGQVLAGKDASWNHLTTIAGNTGLSHFSFCHIASHASFDSLTGRLSGISFYDRDVWLDELWDCAPWPSLVTMAACNSGQSLVHEGDEHIGLPTTLLAAGANTVIGSIWPVLDQDAARLFTSFYDYFLAHNRPSKALALAQRQAFDEEHGISLWASFLCVGQP